jgi:hypothetical protein
MQLPGHYSVGVWSAVVPPPMAFGAFEIVSNPHFSPPRGVAAAGCVTGRTMCPTGAINEKSAGRSRLPEQPVAATGRFAGAETIAAQTFSAVVFGNHLGGAP